MNLSVRQYDPERDASDISSWWRHRHGVDLPIALLPPVGVVALNARGQRIAAAWLYMSVGIGVAFLENPVSVPGLGMKAAIEAFDSVLEALEAIALTHDYGVLVCHTPPAIARVLERSGFVFSDKLVVTGEKLIRKQPKEEAA